MISKTGVSFHAYLNILSIVFYICFFQKHFYLFMPIRLCLFQCAYTYNLDKHFLMSRLALFIHFVFYLKEDTILNLITNI